MVPFQSSNWAENYIIQKCLYRYLSIGILNMFALSVAKIGYIFYNPLITLHEEYTRSCQQQQKENKFLLLMLMHTDSEQSSEIVSLLCYKGHITEGARHKHCFFSSIYCVLCFSVSISVKCNCQAKGLPTKDSTYNYICYMSNPSGRRILLLFLILMFWGAYFNTAQYGLACKAVQNLFFIFYHEHWLKLTTSWPSSPLARFKAHTPFSSKPKSTLNLTEFKTKSKWDQKTQTIVKK